MRIIGSGQGKLLNELHCELPVKLHNDGILLIAL